MAQFFLFDGTRYDDNVADHQQLLEDISDAINTETPGRYSDPEETQAAIDATWENTHHDADFWQNIRAIMFSAPVPIKVERLDVNLTNACRVFVEDHSHLGWKLTADAKDALLAKVAGELEAAIRDGMPTADLDGRVATMLMDDDTQGWEVLDNIIETVFDPYL